MKHSFPIEVQKWIIGKRMPPDKETLQRAKVTPGASVFLYLVSAKSVGLNQEDVMAQRERMLYGQGMYGNITILSCWAFVFFYVCEVCGSQPGGCDGTAGTYAVWAGYVW